MSAKLFYYHKLLVLFFGWLIASTPEVLGQTGYAFLDTSLSAEERIEDLMHQLTTAEKTGLLGYNSPGVGRLGIPQYNWWNEALHGVARAGKATVYPQAIALAATFNDSLIH